jgi:hypothetical protein
MNLVKYRSICGLHITQESKDTIELLPDELYKWDEKTMQFTDRDMSANALLNYRKGHI